VLVVLASFLSGAEAGLLDAHLNMPRSRTAQAAARCFEERFGVGGAESRMLAFLHRLRHVDKSLRSRPARPIPNPGSRFSTSMQSSSKITEKIWLRWLYQASAPLRN
jgi:hypothetical protein